MRAMKSVAIIESDHRIGALRPHRIEEAGDSSQPAELGEPPMPMLVPNHLGMRSHIAMQIVDLQERQHRHQHTPFRTGS